MVVDRSSFAEVTGADESSPPPSRFDSARRVSMADVAAPRRRLGSDRLARGQREPPRRSRHPRPRRGGDGRARLPPAPRGARTAHRPHADDRPGRLDARDGRQLADAAGGGGCRSHPRICAHRGHARRAGRVGAAFDRLREQGVDGVDRAQRGLRARARAPRRRAISSSSWSTRLTDRAPASASCSPTTPAARGRRPRTCSSLGHRTVHLLAGPAGVLRGGRARARLAAGARRRRAAAPEVLRGDWTAASGHRGRRVLAAITAVTAVFAANDQMALGAIRALAEAGRRVPEDVSVVGFDDVADAADYRPPLTTVRQDFDASASAPSRRSSAASRTERRPVETVPTALVVRASTAARAEPALASHVRSLAELRKFGADRPLPPRACDLAR